MDGFNRKVILICIFVLFFSFPALAADQATPRLITVSGDAEIRVAPDEVILTFGVETWNVDLNVAKNENDERVKKVLDVARTFKIEPKHIQTDHISIKPRYKDYYERRQFIGYFVRKTIVVILRDISKFEDLLSKALEGGANYVHGIQFRTTELRKHRDQARSLAIKAAKEKANDLAGELGQKVGKPHMIKEGSVGWRSGYGSSWGRSWGTYTSQNVSQNASSPAEDDGSIALGQIKVNAQVNVSFELE